MQNMHNHADRDDRTFGGELTTEDIANPGATTGAASAAPDARTDEAGQVPTYPGEATADPRGNGRAEEEAAVGGYEDERTPTAVDEPLLGAEDAEGYRKTWSEIQGRFVDDPQEAVRSADTLVAEVMQAFAGTLSEHRSGLEKQWDRGEQVATEDLRQALRAYRSLVNRLLDT